MPVVRLLPTLRVIHHTTHRKLEQHQSCRKANAAEGTRSPGQAPVVFERARLNSLSRSTDYRSVRKRIQHNKRRDQRNEIQSFGRTDCPSDVECLISLLDPRRTRVQGSVPRRLPVSGALQEYKSTNVGTHTPPYSWRYSWPYSW